MAELGNNAATLKQLYDRWHETKGGCSEDFIAIMADDIQWRSLGQGDAELAFTKGGTTKAAVREYMDGLLGQLEMIHYTIDEVIDGGDKVALLGRTAWRSKATGNSFDTPKIDVWCFRDGKAISFMEYYNTAMIAEAMTAPA